MQEDTYGIREAFRREPEQTRQLVKFGLGGAIVIAVLGTVAAMLLNALLAAPVMLAMSLIYGFALVVSAARLVSDASGRRFVESALSKPSRLHGGDEPKAPERMAPVAEQASFNRNYFMLRLQEEVANARRDGREMAVIAIEATAPGVPMNPELAEKIATEFAKIASNHFKTISNSLSMSENEYVMSLPMTDAAETKAFVSKVVQSLGNYWCHFGIAAYPEDGTSAESLIKAARDAVNESREGKSRSKSPAVA